MIMIIAINVCRDFIQAIMVIHAIHVLINTVLIAPMELTVMIVLLDIARMTMDSANHVLMRIVHIVLTIIWVVMIVKRGINLT
mmetsp:Transcript_13141/g.2012  ORF Transcript_13141/g.2012 Transcript_13141/m.2012 type:complete len:83 (-) Transcript_13141:667-915(-)